MIGDVDVEIPDLAEPIVAWRAWLVGGTIFSNVIEPEQENVTYYLRSIHNTTAWPPLNTSDHSRRFANDFITATCNKFNPEDPEVKCTTAPCGPDLIDFHSGKGCGIYAYKNLDGLLWDFPLRGIHIVNPTSIYFQHDAKSSLLVYGKVTLWGNVYDHNRGYRAQYARVESLAYVDNYGKVPRSLIDKLADFYGVPVIEISKEEMDVAHKNCVERHQNEMEDVVRAFRDNLSSVMRAASDLNDAMSKSSPKFSKFARLLKALLP